jgi:uncharacterized membrane protein
MYSIHPLTVHLPLGLLLGNALLTALYLWRREPSLEVGAYHCLWLGWLCILPAVVTGTYEAARLLLGAGAASTPLGWVNAHAVAALAVAAVYWQAWQARRRNPAILDDARQRRGYLVRLALGVALLVLTGWIGGHMVYTLHIGIE